MIHFRRNQLQLENFGPFTHIDDFLSAEECEKLIGIMKKTKLVDAKVSEDGVKNMSVRSTEVCALDYSIHTLSFFQKLEDAICQVNHGCYGFEVQGFHEAVQLMQYKVGDFYDWHMDFGNKQFSKRKLSFSVQLTDPSEYEGGDLEFFRNGNAPKDRGTLIIFPSFMMHKVHAVTKGLRRAMVGWVTGNPYN